LTKAGGPLLLREVESLLYVFEDKTPLQVMQEQAQKRLAELEAAEFRPRSRSQLE